MKTINNDLSKRLYLIKDSLIEGSNIINGNDIVDMNNLAIEFINTNEVSDVLKQDIYTTLVISNILYNNTLNEDKALELSNMGSVEYTLKEGKNPENVYEIIVPYSQRYAYPLNEKVDEKINDKKLKVVGYYLSSKTSKYITNEETMKMQLINNSRSITISSNDKETVIEELKSREISARDTYEIARNEYIRDNESVTNASLIFSAVIIVISLIAQASVIKKLVQRIVNEFNVE